MNRRTFLQTSALAGVAVALPRLAYGAFRTGTFTDLRGGVGIYTERGGTIGWFVSDDALVVIDAQYPETATNCWTGLQERSSRMIDILVNSHHHGDHTAGNGAFRPHTKQILAHENVPTLQQAAAEARGTTEGQVYADATYSGELSNDLGNERLTLRNYGAAHTGGDSIIHFEEADIVHMGDLMFNRMPVFIDLNGGSSTEGWIQTLERAHDFFTDETLFIYGHGNPDYGVTGGRADLLVARDYLSGVHDYVAKGIAEGTPVDDLANIEKLPGFPEHYVDTWKQAVGMNVRAVYQERTM